MVWVLAFIPLFAAAVALEHRRHYSQPRAYAKVIHLPEVHAPSAAFRASVEKLVTGQVTACVG